MFFSFYKRSSKGVARLVHIPEKEVDWTKNEREESILELVKEKT